MSASATQGGHKNLDNVVRHYGLGSTNARGKNWQSFVKNGSCTLWTLGFVKINVEGTLGLHQVIMEDIELTT